MLDARIVNPKGIVLLVENLAIGQKNVLALRLAIRMRASIVVKLAIWRKNAQVPRAIGVPEVVTIGVRDLAVETIFVIILLITVIVLPSETITGEEDTREEHTMITVVVPQVIEMTIGVMIPEMVIRLTMVVLLMDVVDRDLRDDMVDALDLFHLLDDENFLQSASTGRPLVVEVLSEPVPVLVI